MRAAQAAYRSLLAVARADGEVTREEGILLERYRRALGIRRRDARSLERAPGDGDAGFDADDGHEPCRHALRMMARVAWCDGVLAPRERQRLVQVAERLGVGRTELADVLVTVESEMAHRTGTMRRVRRIAAASLVVVVAALILRELLSGGGTRVDDRGAEMEVLKGRIDDLLAADREGAADMQATWDALLERERELERRIAALSRAREVQPAAAGRASPAAAQLAELRARLDRLSRARSTGFKEVEREVGASVLLVVVQYDLVREGRRKRRQGTGSGFFVSPDGLIATNKHVLEPWKFAAELIHLRSRGWRVNPASITRMAWRASAPCFTPDGAWNLATAWHTRNGTLAVERIPDDHLREETRKLPSGARFTAPFHVQDNSDLALLQARVKRPVKALRLDVERPPCEKLDPVMVLGFPTGARILEGGRAETSPSVGVVRKVEDTVFVTAPIVGGNSGGPLLDTRGQVVGVATRVFGDASLACCIQACHLLPLLPDASGLIERARGLGPAGAPLLRLARSKGPSAADRRRMDRLERRWAEARDR